MEGKSPDLESIGSGTTTKRSSVSSGSRSRIRRDFLSRFTDSEHFTEKLEDWFALVLETSGSSSGPVFEVPFELVELQKFDYALEGISFQQLTRMPNAVYASTSTSTAVEAKAYLAIEDFLHATVKSLWEAFWSQDEPVPFSVGCLYNQNMKFYQAEKALAIGKLQGLSATGVLLKNPRHPHGKWDHILELALLRPDIGSFAVDSDHPPSLPVLGEALFYALRILISRSVSRLDFSQSSNCVFLLLVDSQYGGVVKVEGDVNKLDFDVNNVYECAADWIIVCVFSYLRTIDIYYLIVLLTKLTITIYINIDLLGVISHVGDLDTVRDDNYEGMNKRICKIHFRIRDLQNREIECAARGSLANEFSEMWWRNRNSVVVCELTDWRIFSCEGYSYVVDGGEMSRFEFDPQFPESQELKNKFLITSQHTKMSSNYRFYGQGAIRTPQPLR